MHHVKQLKNKKMDLSKTKDYYKKAAMPPQNALKTIIAGRLKGKSDINPQWRYEALTEIYGLCGFGWRYEIMGIKHIPGANNEIAIFARVKLMVKIGDEWSFPIIGTGGSMFVANESKGLYTSDEAEKMAITDALSVCCKMIGIGSDIYRGLSDSKYYKTEIKQEPQPQQKIENKNPILSKASFEHLVTLYNDKKFDEFKKNLKYLEDNNYSVSEKYAEQLKSMINSL